MPATPRRAGRSARPESRFISEVVADNVRAYRLLRRLIQGDLAQRLRGLGHEKWSQATVSEVERYSRTVNIEEIFALAQVLEVTVADLLDPHGPDGRGRLDVDMGPSGVMNRRIAHAWVRDQLVPRLEWTGERYEAGSLVMVPREGHEGVPVQIMNEMRKEHRRGMSAAQRKVFDQISEALDTHEETVE